MSWQEANTNRVRQASGNDVPWQQYMQGATSGKTDYIFSHNGNSSYTYCKVATILVSKISYNCYSVKVILYSYLILKKINERI